MARKNAVVAVAVAACTALLALVVSAVQAHMIRIEGVREAFRERTPAEGSTPPPPLNSIVSHRPYMSVLRRSIPQAPVHIIVPGECSTRPLAHYLTVASEARGPSHATDAKRSVLMTDALTTAIAPNPTHQLLAVIPSENMCLWILAHENAPWRFLRDILYAGYRIAYVSDVEAWLVRAAWRAVADPEDAHLRPRLVRVSPSQRRMILTGEAKDGNDDDGRDIAGIALWACRDSAAISDLADVRVMPINYTEAVASAPDDVLRTARALSPLTMPAPVDVTRVYPRAVCETGTRSSKVTSGEASPPNARVQLLWSAPLVLSAPAGLERHVGASVLDAVMPLQARLDDASPAAWTARYEMLGLSLHELTKQRLRIVHRHHVHRNLVGGASDRRPILEQFDMGRQRSSRRRLDLQPDRALPGQVVVFGRSERRRVMRVPLDTFSVSLVPGDRVTLRHQTRANEENGTWIVTRVQETHAWMESPITLRPKLFRIARPHPDEPEDSRPTYVMERSALAPALPAGLALDADNDVSLMPGDRVLWAPDAWFAQPAASPGTPVPAQVVRTTPDVVVRLDRAVSPTSSETRAYDDAKFHPLAMCFAADGRAGVRDSLPDASERCARQGHAWDRPCESDADCPFFQGALQDASRRLDAVPTPKTMAHSGRGGCRAGYCEMPVAVRRIGYRHWDARTQPLCQGTCDPMIHPDGCTCSDHARASFA